MDSTYKNILVITLGFVGLDFVLGLGWLSVVGFAVGLLSIASPWIAEKVLWAWFGLAKVLGYINSRVILSVLYYGLLVPIASVSRVFGNRPLQLKGGSQTYFSDRDHTYTKTDFENPW